MCKSKSSKKPFTPSHPLVYLSLRPPLERFADFEDVDDVESIVTRSYNDEDGAALVPCPTQSHSVRSDLEGGSDKRWLIVETSYPDEVMVACCRLSLSSESKECFIDVMAVRREFQGKGAGTYLLKKAENVAKGMGCGVSVIGVGMWMKGFLGWAERRGYVQGGGELWQEEKMGKVPQEIRDSIKAETNVPPMMVRLKKSLSGAGSTSKGSTEKPAVRSDIAEFMKGKGAEMDFIGGLAGILNALPSTSQEASSPSSSPSHPHSNVQSRNGSGLKNVSGDDTNLESLVGDLLKALKTDEGRKEFKRLAVKDGDNMEGLIGAGVATSGGAGATNANEAAN